MEQLFQMESVSARIRKKGDLWSGGNFISNQSHDKIITERRGEAGGWCFDRGGRPEGL